jgi:hypothetical protein
MYKNYEIEKTAKGYTTRIEDGMFTYSWLIDDFKTLKEAKDRINRYILKIENLYK